MVGYDPFITAYPDDWTQTGHQPDWFTGESLVYVRELLKSRRHDLSHGLCECVGRA